MDNSLTVESVLKEIKKSINTYEKAIGECEKEANKKEYDNLSNLKKRIENKLKLVKTIVKTEEQRFQLNSYEKLNEQLNARYKNIMKANKQKLEQSNFEKLFNQKSSEIKNKENIEYLDEEKESLKNTIKISSEIAKSLEDANDELEEQNNKLSDSSSKLVQIIGKIPIINQMLGKIKCVKIKEKMILGLVLGGIIVLGLYLTFKKS